MKAFTVKVLIVALSFTGFGVASAGKNVTKDAPATNIFRVNR